MKEVTKLMINEYNIKKLGYDMMGYTFNKTNDLTYHHLIVPKRYGGGYTRENGAILVGTSAHPYLHLIESKDEEIFARITSEILDEKIKGKIDLENLYRIRDLLHYFEYEFRNAKGSKGKSLIKYEYKYDRIKL